MAIQKKLTASSKTETVSATTSPIAKTGSQVIVNKTAIGDTTSEVITINKFETDTAKVTISASIKKSDGAYGNAEVFVSLSVPCYVEEIEDIYEATTVKLHQMLDNEMAKFSSAEAPTAYTNTKAEVVEESESLEEGEEQNLTEEDVAAMKKDELIKLVDDYGLDVDTGAKKTLAILRKEVITALFTEEEEAAEEVAEEPEVATVSEEEGEFIPYTKEQLSENTVTLEDLKEALSDFDVDPSTVKVAKNALPKVVKAAYVEAILQAQDNYFAEQD